jgi:hypothetical protein
MKPLIFLFQEISIDIVPAIRILDWYPTDAKDCFKNDGCYFVFQQPQKTHPRVGWTEPHAYVCFALAESNSIRKSPTVIKAAYMVCKRLVKHFTNMQYYMSHVLKSAVLYSMDDNDVESKCSDSTFGDFLSLNQEELAYWVAKIMRQLLVYAVQDYAPSYIMPSMHVPVWKFERYVGFSHDRLRRHGLTFENFFSEGFWERERDKRLKDTLVRNIVEAYVCSHLMYWSVLPEKRHS